MEADLILQAILTFSIVFALFLATSCESEQENLCGDRKRQQYEVLSAILNKEYAGSDQTIVVYEKSVSLDNFDFSEVRLGRYELPPSLIRDFLDINSSSSTFEKHFDLAVPYKFMSEEQFRSINAVYLERFDRFKEAFPEAHTLSGTRTVRFTLPGFSSDFSRSIVLVEYWNGRKSIYFLRRTGCGWGIDKEIPFAYH